MGDGEFRILDVFCENIKNCQFNYMISLSLSQKKKKKKLHEFLGAKLK